VDNLRSSDVDFYALARQIKHWGFELGFQQVGISDTDLQDAEHHLNNWLAAGCQGEMEYMQRHGTRRTRPAELVPGTVRVISVRMDYWPDQDKDPHTLLDDPVTAFISRYALGRDYHKVLRGRLQELADRIKFEVGEFGYRAFADSAPVMEKALAEKAGLGWIGKHSNLINQDAGSWFFLGELYTDLPLPIDEAATNHCGSCRACIDVCPTGAIVGPYRVDARRCISYLTIELRGSIPVALRPMIGNRIFGCDDCQLFCPWNKFAQTSQEPDFVPRSELAERRLVDLFAWSEEQFLRTTEGSAIRRIGYECWLRNIAVALGNSRADDETTELIIAALNARREHPSVLVREHVQWALQQQTTAAGKAQ
jgi:epoxyqueuosine reductase